MAALLAGGLEFCLPPSVPPPARRCAVCRCRVGLVALNRPDFALVATKDIASFEQLRGRVIGAYAPRSGTVNVVLHEMMRRRGFKAR